MMQALIGALWHPTGHISRFLHSAFKITHYSSSCEVRAELFSDLQIEALIAY